MSASAENGEGVMVMRAELLPYFFGAIFSVFNWSLGSDLPSVNWQDFCGEMPLLRYHVKEVRCLQI